MTTKEHNVTYRKVDRGHRLTSNEIEYIKQGIKRWLDRFNEVPNKNSISRPVYIDLRNILNYIDFKRRVEHRDKSKVIRAINN